MPAFLHISSKWNEPSLNQVTVLKLFIFFWPIIRIIRRRNEPFLMSFLGGSGLDITVLWMVLTFDHWWHYFSLDWCVICLLGNEMLKMRAKVLIEKLLTFGLWVWISLYFFSTCIDTEFLRNIKFFKNLEISIWRRDVIFSVSTDS